MKLHFLYFLILIFLTGCSKEKSDYNASQLPDYDYHKIYPNKVQYAKDGYVEYLNDTMKIIFTGTQKMYILSNLYKVSAVSGPTRVPSAYKPFYKELYFTTDTVLLEYSVENSKTIKFTSQENIYAIYRHPEPQAFQYKSMDILGFTAKKLKVQMHGIAPVSKNDTSFIEVLSPVR